MTFVDVVEKSYSTTIKQVEIELVQYEIGNFATAYVTFYNTENKVDKQELVKIDGDDFNVNWVTDDDFIEIVLSKLNIEKIPNSLPLKRSDLTDSSVM
jgi:hypothetical protein